MRVCRNRKREQHQIDPGAAGELDNVVDLAEFRLPGTGNERTGSLRSSNTPRIWISDRPAH
jgi:hypothetical protein